MTFGGETQSRTGLTGSADNRRGRGKEQERDRFLIIFAKRGSRGWIRARRRANRRFNQRVDHLKQEYPCTIGGFSGRVIVDRARLRATWRAVSTGPRQRHSRAACQNSQIVQSLATIRIVGYKISYSPDLARTRAKTVCERRGKEIWSPEAVRWLPCGPPPSC